MVKQRTRNLIQQDAWGWKEDDLPAEDIPEDTAWDDPWVNPPEAETLPEPFTSTCVPSHRRMFLLKMPHVWRKLASKNKKHLNGHSSTSSTPAASPVPPLEPRVLVTPPSQEQPEHNPPRNQAVSTQVNALPM